MNQPDKNQPVATVDEEPTSSTTPDRQINQGSQEATRNTSNRGSASQPKQPQDQHDKGCGCG